MTLSRRALLAGSAASLALVAARCPVLAQAPGSAEALAAAFPNDSEAVRAQLAELYQAALAGGEREVNVYTTRNTATQFTQPDTKGLGRIVALFHALFPGITVNALDGNAVVDSVAAEHVSGRFLGDVVYHGDTELSGLKAAGHLAAFTPANAGGLIAARDADPEGQAYSPFRQPHGIIYNSALVAEAEVPVTWEALADPAWQGRFLVLGPHSLSARHYANLYAQGRAGDGFDTAIAAAIANGDVTETYNDLTTAVIEGRYPVAVFVGGSLVLEQRDRGLPLAFIDSEATLWNHFWIGVLATAPNPNAARLFAAFQFSLLVQETYAEETYLAPNLSAAGTNSAYPPIAEPTSYIPFGETAPLTRELRPRFEALYP